MSHEVPQAFSREHLSQLWGFAWRLSGDIQNAEDLVLRAFSHALEVWRESRMALSERDRMYSIVYSMWLADAKASKPVWQDREGITLDTNVRASTTTSEKILRQIETAANTLPPEERAVLLLIFAEGLCGASVAAIVDAPLDTVIERLSRATSMIAAHQAFAP